MNAVEFMPDKGNQSPGGVDIRYRAFSHFVIPFLPQQRPVEATEATQEPDYQADHQNRAKAEMRAVSRAVAIAKVPTAEAEQQKQDDYQQDHTVISPALAGRPESQQPGPSKSSTREKAPQCTSLSFDSRRSTPESNGLKCTDAEKEYQDASTVETVPGA